VRFGRSLRLSLRALLAHRVRAVLALAAVSAGTAAVVLTSAIGTGVQRDIGRRIESTGVNLLVVRPARLQRSAARRDIGGSATSLELEDYQAIAALPLVRQAAPATMTMPVRIKVDAASSLTRMVGTTPAFPAVRRFEVQRGRFFDDDDDRNARRVVVLGARVAALFDADPVGRQIRIRRVPFDVIGVLAPKGALAEGDEDNQVVVPIRTALRRVLNVTWLDAVFVSVRDPQALDGAERGIARALGERHRMGRSGQPDFDIENAARFFAMRKQTVGTLGRLSTGLGAIALVVGGTGILALMLLSVKERSNEIGLRMAVGARPRDILMQFLLEATLLAVGGWAAGLVIGAAGAAGVAVATAWPVAVPVTAVVASFAAAVFLGLGFGTVPARAATRIPPLQALLAA